MGAMVATVTGNLVAVTGSARAGVELTFEPRSLRLAEEGSRVVSPSTGVTTDENGDQQPSGEAQNRSGRSRSGRGHQGVGG
jgi:hypothetical protein